LNIFFWSKFSNFVQSISAKSRLQSPDSLHGILVDKQFKDSFYEKLKNFKTLEEYLITRNLKSEEPGPQDLCLDLDTENENLMDHVIIDEENIKQEPVSKYALTSEPITRPGWRRRERPLIELNFENSLGLLNKYCNRLPCDTFTQLSVLKKTDELPDGNFQTTLVLPNNSHLRGVIQGDPQTTEALSKQSAALNACQKLRAAGELDDFLFHTGKEIEKYRIETDPFAIKTDYQRQKQTCKTPGPEGGPKRRQLYNRHVPKCFRQKIKSEGDTQGGLPQPEKAVYVYRISMFFRHGINDRYNYRGRRLHRPEDSPRSFGIISGMPIPHTIPSFSIFDRSGEEGVHVEPVHQMVTFSAAQLELFRQFHQFVFKDVIRIERPGGCVQFKPERSPLPYLIVPLSCENSVEWSIDWNFLVDALVDSTRFEHANDHERRVRQFSDSRPYVFRKSEVNDAVVIASYRRHDSPNQNRFYVAEIQYDMDPDSPFPSDDYKSFRQVTKIILFKKLK